MKQLIGGRNSDDIISILLDIQQKYGYVSSEVISVLPSLTGVSSERLTSILTFYKAFHLEPMGRHNIKVCIGAACHVKGARQLVDDFRAHLHIAGDSNTDDNMLFSVTEVACLGCCMLAPAVQIDDVIYGKVCKQDIPDILEDFLNNQSSDRTELTAVAAGHCEISICNCSSCKASGSGKVLEELYKLIDLYKLDISVKETACTGNSYNTPLLSVFSEQIKSKDHLVYYANVRPEMVKDIVFQYARPSSLLKKIRAGLGMKFERLIEHPDDGLHHYKLEEISNLQNHRYNEHQVLITTEGAGHIEPADINSFFGKDEFSSLRNILTMRRESIIRHIEQCGLRGRGGGGFNTGLKWRLTSETEADEKYVVCNADEGDPGAFMDRMLLESFSFRVIEGVIIAAYAVDAHKGYVYVRDEYPLAVERLSYAIKKCIGHKLIGDDILGTGFSFDLEIVHGAGAFVCGEETALIEALEGRRGTPRMRPPYPSVRGYKGMPTLINNVETFASVPWILRMKPIEFAKYGTAKSKGTKTFALAGKINRGGLIEVPMGTTIRKIIEDIGGGVVDGRKLKAVQIGGPSGGCIPCDRIDVPVDYESLQSMSAIMGSGGMVVMDENDCMVDIAKYFLEFTMSESCGRCSACRVGIARMYEILENICAGKGSTDDIDKLEHLAELVREGSMCGLGRSAPNPVISTIRWFREEYEEHISGYCKAGVCKPLTTFEISEDCIGCSMCARACPEQAIKSVPYKRHYIDQDKCTKCGACRSVCRQNAVINVKINK